MVEKTGIRNLFEWITGIQMTYAAVQLKYIKNLFLFLIELKLIQSIKFNFVYLVYFDAKKF